MICNQNKPYWKNISFSPSANWVDGQPDDVDVIIIGAGMSGLITGIELAKLKRKCYIIDIGIPGMRSSSKSDGCLFLGNIEPILDTIESPKALFYKLISLSLENKYLFDKFYNMFSISNWCEYYNMGGIRVADSAAEADSLKESIKIYKHFGVHATWLSENSFRNIAGVRWCQGAIYIPNEGIFNPLDFVSGLVNANRILGNDVVSGINFSNLETLPNGKVLVSDIDGNVIQSNAVVICLNAFTHHTSIKFLREHIKPMRVQYIATKKLEKNLISAIPPYAFSFNSGKEYFRTHNDRIIFGGGNELEEMPTKEYAIMADAKINSHITSLLQGRMSYHLDCIRDIDIEPEFIWTRNVATTKDNLPIVGQLPGYKNVYINSGYGAHGISYLFISGKIISELICAGKSNVYGREVFDPLRF